MIMRKNFFAIYALVGALVASPVFTSCVDDSESASVTALRGAKAEQLKSIAALNNAKAQAETTLAQAEAALKAAQAAQEQAIAEKEAAEAAIKELELKMKQDKYDAELAAALAQAQANKLAAEKNIAQYQADMEKAALLLEKDLISLEKQLMDAQKELADKKDQIAEAEYQELKTLTNKYGNLLVSYTNYSNSILEEEAEIAATEAELADWEVVIAEDIAEKEKSIEWAKYQIETLKQYTNYTADIEAMEAELKKLGEAQKLAEDKYQAANKAYTALDYDALYSEAKIDELKNAIDETNMGKYRNNWDLYSYGVNPIVDYDRSNGFDYNGFSIEKDEFTYNNQKRDSLNVKLEYQDVREFKLYIDGQIANWDVAGKKAAINTATTGLQAVYDAAVKATSDAKAAWDAAAEADKAAKKAAYETALNEEKQAEIALENAKVNLEDAEKAVEELNLIYALASDPKAAEDFVAAVKAYNEAIVAIHTEIAEAYFAMEAASKAKNEADTEYKTLYAVYNGNNNNINHNYISFYDLFFNYDHTEFTVDGNNYELQWGSNWGFSGNFDELQNLKLYIIEYTAGNDAALGIDNLIKELEATIENIEEEIEELKDVTSMEQALEIAKVQLDNKKNYQVALKAELDYVKAELDALQAKLIATEEEAA